AWRRPLSDSETQDLHDAFAAEQAVNGFEAGIRTVFEILLEAPEFLYRVEVGNGTNETSPPAGSIELTPWERASRLSYLLWESTPDNELLQAAGSGQLETKDDVRKQAERMLDDPRARAMTTHFYEQWLELDKLDFLEKDRTAYPQFDPE